MHLAQMLAADCWGALDFIDSNGKFIERKLTIKSTTLDSPPAGGKKKGCVYFEGDPRKCFFSSKQLKSLGALLGKYESADWVGAVLLVSADHTTLKGKPTMGMVIKNAAFRSAPKPPQGTDVQA